MANYCVYSGGNGASGAVAGSVPTSGEWAAAYTDLNSCLAGITPADGDVVFVAHDHVANYIANLSMTITLASGLIKVISIDRTNTTTATPLAGGKENTNGNYSFAFQINGSAQCYMYGITLEAGDGTAIAQNINIGTAGYTNQFWAFDSCTLSINSSSASPTLNLNGRTLSGALYELKNCTFSFGHASQRIKCTYGAFNMQNCSLSGTAPTVFLYGVGTSIHHISSCDFSSASYFMDGTGDFTQEVYAHDCKMPANLVYGTHTGVGTHTLEAIACSSSDQTIDYYKNDGTGVVQESASVYLTTPGSQHKEQDGTATSYSLEVNPNASYVSKAFPCYTPWISKFVGSTGSKTITLKIAYDDATLLKDTECWIEVEFFTQTTTPLGKIETSAPIVSGTVSRDILNAGSNLTDSSEAWTGTGGWTNEQTYTLSKAVTVNQQGYIRARVAVAKDVTVYVDCEIGVA